MKPSFKVRFLNVFRNFFRIGPIEKTLAGLTVGRSPSHFLSKLVPNPYQYSQNAYRYINRDGVKMKLDISDYIGHYLYFGFHDDSHEKLFALCKPGANVLDIGANIGWTLLTMSQLSWTGKVFGFEPDPYNYQRCLENVSLNNFTNVSLFPVGLSDVNATLNMEIRVASNRGGNRIVSNNTGHKVEVVRLDDFIPVRNLEHIDVIKIDVEGYELNVLKGAASVLQRHHPVLFIELDDDNLRDQSYSAKDLVVFLNNNGYRNLTSANDGRVVSATDDFSRCHFDLIAR
jgi:FkbM family methyltransferase